MSPLKAKTIHFIQLMNNSMLEKGKITNSCSFYYLGLTPPLAPGQALVVQIFFCFSTKKCLEVCQKTVKIALKKMPSCSLRAMLSLVMSQSL